MARKKAEIDLLGVASKDDLVKFKVSKQVDKELAATVSQINKTGPNNSVVTEEELLRIKKKGEQEILDIQNELKEFKISEERKISFLPLEEEEEEEPYIPTKLEKITNKIKAPFVKLVDLYDGKTRVEKFNVIRNFFIVILVLVLMGLLVFASKKYRIISDGYIFLDLKEIGAGHLALPLEEMYFDGNYTTLTRVEIDGQNTVFTFDEKIDFKNTYSVYMIDNDKVKYDMDYHFMENAVSPNDSFILSMVPLRDGVRQFTLVFTNMNTGNSYEFEFKLGKFLEKSKFIKLYNLTNLEWAGLNVDNFFASSTGSVINYSLSSKGLDFTYKVINMEGTNSDIYEDGSIIPSKQHKIVQYEFPERKIILLQQYFSQPKDFTSEIEFKTDNIFKSYDTDISLSRTEAQEGVKLDFGEYSLYIEGIQKKGDTAVLVYHCIDNSYNADIISEEKPNENFMISEKAAQNSERVYTILDVNIVTYDKDGKVQSRISPSKVNASPQGTDVVFVDDRLNNVVSNFYIEINNVNIRDSIYSSKVDLAEYAIVNRDVIEYENELMYIEDAFTSRLSYRATELPRSSIFGFTDEIIKDKKFMEQYIPINLQEEAKYSTDIITSTLKNNEIYLIVEESFSANTVNGYIHEIKRHRVIYNILEHKIVFDEIF